MILLWFKIISYKIYKMITKEPSNRADTGAEIDVPRAHVSCDHCLHEAHDRSCAECGCTARPDLPDGDAGVHVGLDPSAPGGIAPVFARDALRLAALDEDRRAREEAAGLDPSRCPCGGRHFPSADACRWCLCHDPSRVNHLSQEAVDRLRYDMSVPPFPTHPVAEIIRNSYRPCSVCGAPDHAGVTHPGTVDGIMDTGRERFPGLETITPEDVHAEIMDSSPAKEIVVCGRCGHPDHGAGDGRCAFQVASRMQDEGFHMCPCTVPRHDPHKCEHQVSEHVDSGCMVTGCRCESSYGTACGREGNS